MATTLPVPTILTVAKICEYLASQNIPYTDVFRGAALDSRIATMIYMERKAIQNRYDINPSDSTLRGNSNYLFAILGRFQITGQNILASVSVSAPEITGPTNQSVNQGDDATFTVSVVSSLPVTYVWFRNGVAIPGATSISYTLPNAQPGDDGALFSVVATNAAGSTASVQATLTVAVTITGFFHYGSVDPGPDLQASIDNFTYQTSFAITHNANISVTLPAPSTPNMYLIVKVPSGESAKTVWSNTPSNNGTIPDSAFQTPVTFGGFTYIYTRVAVSMDTNSPLILS